MKHLKLTLLALIALLVAGCAGSGSSGHRAGAAKAPPQVPADAPTAAAEQSAPQGAWAGDDADYGEASEAPSAPAAAAPEAGYEASDERASGAAPSRDAYRPRPTVKRRERPGLATKWGEQRSSHVTTAPFIREESLRPFATASVFYNNAEGVRAMAARSGISDFGDNLARAAQSQLSVRILDGGGRPLHGTRAGGRSYVVGQHGARYIIQIRNHTGNRVEAVATVDGLDVIDGRPGAFGKRGYIVNPFSTVEIEGFRRSHSSVATFRFGAVSDSYAARKGNARNVGVIGVAFFHEAGSRWPWTDGEVDRRHDADPFPGRYADPPPRW